MQSSSSEQAVSVYFERSTLRWYIDTTKEEIVAQKRLFKAMDNFIPKECCNSKCRNVFYVEQQKFHQRDLCDGCVQKSKQMEKQEKKQWNTTEMQEEFKVLGFGYGYCAVERKSDGKKGSLSFGGRPRIYRSFVAHED